jgi:type IV pilus assembly protein PilE
MKQRAGGFTLIELMVVVAVVAILMAIAYPSYTAYIARGHIAEAKSYLMELAQREQQYLLDNRDYADYATISGPVTQPPDVFKDYTVTVIDLTGTIALRPLPHFTIQAVPKSGTLPFTHGNDTLAINEQGKKTPAPGTANFAPAAW